MPHDGNSLFIHEGHIITMDKKDSIWENGDILIENGKIKAIGEVSPDQYTADSEVINASNKIVIPGFINAHTHSYANLFKGTTDHFPLEIWELIICTMRSRMTPDDVRQSVLVGITELLKEGTTCVVDNLPATSKGLCAAAEEYLRSGIRAFMAPMVKDKKYHQTIPLNQDNIPEQVRRSFEEEVVVSADELLEMTGDLASRWHGCEGRLFVMAAPSGPQRCTKRLLVGLQELAEEYNLLIQTHFLETKVQAITGNMFFGKRMPLYLDEIGLLSPRMQLVHSVWLDDEDLDLLARRGVAVIHNPISNLFLGGGTANINKLQNAGIKVGLGTDSPNCCGRQSMFLAMNLASLISRVIDLDFNHWLWAEDVLRMATIGNAELLGLADRIGSLEIGKEADIVILNKTSTSFNPLNDVMRQIVYCESGRSVDTVIVGGKILLRNGEVELWNEKELLESATRFLNPYLKKVQYDFEKMQPQIDYIRSVYFNLFSDATLDSN